MSYPLIWCFEIFSWLCWQSQKMQGIYIIFIHIQSPLKASGLTNIFCFELSILLLCMWYSSISGTYDCGSYFLICSQFEHIGKDCHFIAGPVPSTTSQSYCTQHHNESQQSLGHHPVLCLVFQRYRLLFKDWWIQRQMGGIQERVWLVVITTSHCRDKTRARNVN